MDSAGLSLVFTGDPRRVSVSEDILHEGQIRLWAHQETEKDLATAGISKCNPDYLGLYSTTFNRMIEVAHSWRDSTFQDILLSRMGFHSSKGVLNLPTQSQDTTSRFSSSSSPWTPSTSGIAESSPTYSSWPTQSPIQPPWPSSSELAVPSPEWSSIIPSHNTVMNPGLEEQISHQFSTVKEALIARVEREQEKAIRHARQGPAEIPTPPRDSNSWTEWLMKFTKDSLQNYLKVPAHQVDCEDYLIEDIGRNILICAANESIVTHAHLHFASKTSLMATHFILSNLKENLLRSSIPQVGLEQGIALADEALKASYWATFNLRQAIIDAISDSPRRDPEVVPDPNRSPARDAGSQTSLINVPSYIN